MSLRNQARIGWTVIRRKTTYREPRDGAVSGTHEADVHRARALEHNTGYRSSAANG